MELPYEKGLYAITGENGVGKSTILAALSKLFYPGALTMAFQYESVGAKVSLLLDGLENVWIKKAGGWQKDGANPEIKCDGTIESSLIFGSRFANVHKDFIKQVNKVQDYDLMDADTFVVENLGLILRKDKNFYKGLKRIQSDTIAQDLGFNRVSYFWTNSEKKTKLAQLFMSSGELLLIGLLDFINRQKFHRVKNNVSKSIVLIDEIELALHPSSQQRLVQLLGRLALENELCIYTATHSIQIINGIEPSKIFHIERNFANNLQVTNPCYPAYATRSLYTNDGFDFLLLVEDVLARHIIEKIIKKYDLSASRLIKILPCGGWKETLYMHHDFAESFIAGKSCKIFSILDGDIQDECNAFCDKNKKFSVLGKRFLPIKSMEKYIRENLVVSPNAEFAKKFGDTFFSYKSLNEILSEYREKKKDTKDGKELWNYLIEYAMQQGKSKELFESEVCEFIYENEDFSSLDNHLKTVLSSGS